MKIKVIICGITLFLIVLVGLLQISFTSLHSEERFDWAEPNLFEAFPNTYEVNGFQMDIQEGIISAVIWRTRQVNDRFLDASQIFFFQKDLKKEFEIRRLISGNYPAEQPIIFVDNPSEVHFLWGDRHQDPQFEEWNTKRPQSLSFSTNLIYGKLCKGDIDSFKTTSIFKGNLSTKGLGDIGFPIQMIKDDDGWLHTVFKADSIFKSMSPQRGQKNMTRPYITYMNRKPKDDWESYKFLKPGNNPAIVALPDDRLVVAWLGSDPNQLSTNDVQVIFSKNKGLSWSDPELVFFSGQSPGRMLDLTVGPNDTLHLIWGRQTRGLPVPNELWHSFSEDNGKTWTTPTRFFKLKPKKGGR